VTPNLLSSRRLARGNRHRRPWVRRTRTWLAIPATVTLLGSGLTAAPQLARAATPAVSYTYDADGRLASVTSTSGQTATYQYDAEGNLLSISYSGAAVRRPAVRRVPARRPEVTAASARLARPGSTVTIDGTGFSRLADADVVRIGSLFAPVIAATPTTLKVSVPPGPGGAVSVTTEGGTAKGPDVAIARTRLFASPIPGSDRHPLRAAQGVTAVSGLVETNAGGPLAKVQITLTGVNGGSPLRTTTDASGRFLLAGLSAGRHQLVIDGNQAGRRPYGLYAEPVELPGGRTTVLPWITYLTPLDQAHAITIGSPTARNRTLTSPKLPGLQIQIPKGTVIRDYYGHIVHRISLTALAEGRTPFPWAPGMATPYFSLQPGDATVTGPGLRVIYPNNSGQPPGTAIPYLVDSPNWPGTGWWRYGTGHVTANGRQIVPDAGTTYHYLLPGGDPVIAPPDQGPPPGDPCFCGDPVDPSTGLFLYNQTDLTLADVDSVALTRTYRQLDDTVRDFGIGMSDSLNVYVSVASNGDFDLIQPNGGSVAYAPTATTGVYDAVGSPTGYVGSVLTLAGSDPDGPLTIALTNGTVLSFSDPAYLVQETDRFGNSITINRTLAADGADQIINVVTSDGLWLDFTYGNCVAASPSTQCVTQVTDNSGRTVNYAYDADGRLITVTNPARGTTTYTWAPCITSITCTEMLTATDPDGHTFISNTYDPTTGLITGQTDADNGTWSYSYSMNQGQIDQTSVTNPRGVVDILSFDSNGYPSSETDAAGTSDAETTTTVYDPTTHLLTSETDPLGRTTDYTYDSLGNLTSMTDLAGTSSPSTYTFTYDPTFSRLTSVTDPLGRTTTISYNDQAQTETVTNASGQRWVTTFNDEGQPIGVTDPLGNTTYTSYLYGEPVATIDPLGRATSIYRDASGLPLEATDPEGNTTSYTWTPLDQLASVTDPTGGVTTYGYDPDGLLTSLTDADGHETTFSYDPMGQLAKQTDALGKSQAYAYDLMGDVTSYTDRDGAESTYTYDSLDRLIKANYGVSGGASQSSISYNWDLGNRMTKAADSATGTYLFTYDGLNDILSASSPQGKVSYTYNAAGQRTDMLVPNQAKIIYSYNSDSQLAKIIQGSVSVPLIYDADSRLESVTLPDGVMRKTSYDAASEPTAVNFTSGAAQVGTLDYGYTADGQVSSVSGSLATVNLPGQVASADYNADNELTSLDGTAYSYDADGNLLSDGTNSYSWNARGQLASISGGTTASFAYDPFGRQQTATVNGTATSFIYDGPNVVQELSGTTPTANLLSGGINQYYQLTTPSGTNSSFLTDALGNTIALASSAGQLTTSYAYDPSGAVTSSGAASPNTFEFAGTQNEGTGVYPMGARYYSPSSGSFISQDPIGQDGGTSDLYQYAAGDPANITDPLGLGSFSSFVQSVQANILAPIAQVSSVVQVAADGTLFASVGVAIAASALFVVAGVGLPVVAAALVVGAAALAVSEGAGLVYLLAECGSDSEGGGCQQAMGLELATEGVGDGVPEGFTNLKTLSGAFQKAEEKAMEPSDDDSADNDSPSDNDDDDGGTGYGNYDPYNPYYNQMCPEDPGNI
jgi:RHS repeat-associated protein